MINYRAGSSEEDCKVIHFRVKVWGVHASIPNYTILMFFSEMIKRHIVTGACTHAFFKDSISGIRLRRE